MTTRRLFLIISALAAIELGNSAVMRAQQPAATEPLVFDGVTVIDVQQGRLLPAQRVVIVGNRIRTMGDVRAVQVPTGARVVDARGKYLIPGLWDMHVHPRRSTDIFYPLFIATGVTGIRDAGSNVPLDTLILWRRQILAGTRVGPARQILSGPAIDEATPCKRWKTGWLEGPSHIYHDQHTCVADVADARHLVDSLKAAGADMIKMYDLSRAMYFAVAAETRRAGVPVGGHNLVTSAIEASDSGATILDHPRTADLTKLCLSSVASVEGCQPVAERFRHNGTWWVPTFIIYATTVSVERAGRIMFGKPMYGPASRVTLERFYQFASAFWAGSVKSFTGLRDSASIVHMVHAPTTGSPTDSDGTLRIAHRVGLPILAGTDGSDNEGGGIKRQLPGFSLHAELATYVEEGLTPLEALQTATLNPAKALHGTDSLGTVAPGKLADLVLLDADPLSDITNTAAICAVVANGRYFDRAALDQLLADVQSKVKQAP